MYSALNVAEYLIMRCNELNRPISNLKLQKLLYFVQAEFLVAKGTPCFPECIEAWDFGPVVPDIYYHYKKYGGASIINAEQVGKLYLYEEDKKLIDGIIEECAHISSPRLTQITQNQTPWVDAYNPSGRNSISNQSIKDFFEVNAEQPDLELGG